MSHIEHRDSIPTNMSRTELISEILKFKGLNECTLKRIENYEQQLYEMKRELSTVNAMEEHIYSEIESLQNADKSVSNKLSKKVNELEEEIHVLKQTNNENIEFYESELHEKQLKILTFKENLKTKENTLVKADQEKIKQYANEIAELESNIEKLISVVTDSEMKYAEIVQETELLEIKISELSAVMSDLKECLNSKRQATQERKELVQSLQDEIVVLQMEVDKLKNVPSEKAAKGNSLFAEVDDNRLKLKKHIQIVNQKYTDMKLKYTNKTQELKKLHADYEVLTKTIENKNNLHEDQSELIESYKKDFDRLTEHISRSETELALMNEVNSKHMTREMKCAEEMVSITRKKLQELHKELYSDSLARVDCEQKLYEAKQELTRCQTEAVQLRITTLMLNQTMEELRLRETPMAAAAASVTDSETVDKYPTKDDSFENEALREREGTFDKNLTTRTVIKQEHNNDILDMKQLENKENQIGKSAQHSGSVRHLTGKMKRVNFSESTVEPKATDRSRRRVLTVPCVHIPSIRKQ